ncbi:hypothetical protein [Stackebrandtia soli]|uniref:hypothetical protein n=1 Tax=Stackebrandtia soli TaxID=1892856 RepID=UPI0039EB3398
MWTQYGIGWTAYVLPLLAIAVAPLRSAPAVADLQAGLAFAAAVVFVSMFYGTLGLIVLSLEDLAVSVILTVPFISLAMAVAFVVCLRGLKRGRRGAFHGAMAIELILIGHYAYAIADGLLFRTSTFGHLLSQFLPGALSLLALALITLGCLTHPASRRHFQPRETSSTRP